MILEGDGEVPKQHDAVSVTETPQARDLPKHLRDLLGDRKDAHDPEPLDSVDQSSDRPAEEDGDAR